MEEEFLVVGGSYDGERISVSREILRGNNIRLPVKKSFPLPKLFMHQEKESVTPYIEEEVYVRFRLEYGCGYAELLVAKELSDKEILDLLIKGYRKGGSKK